jgi:hypothetical protein
MGKSSVYLGYNSGLHDDSDENIYIGLNTGTLKSGGMNTYVGKDAGKYSTGSQNTYIGNEVCSGNQCSGNYNLFSGANAGFYNTVGSGNVFLGTVSGSLNTEGSWNVFIGQSSGHSNKQGNSNIFIGANSGITNVAGQSSICIGEGSDVSSETALNQISIGNGVVAYGDNTLNFPKNLVTLPSGTEVNFSHSGGGCLYPVSSSIRWKNNIKDIENDLNTEKVYDLRPVVFNPAPGHGDPQETHIGLIAEEVEKLFPVLVPKDDKNRPSSVRYSLLAVILLQELKKLRDRTEKEILELKTKLYPIINEQVCQ